MNFRYAFAQISISEVVYDREGSDDGHEWIEVQNIGTELVDFSTYKLFEGNVNHKITFVSGEEKISPQNFAIIVQNSAVFLKSFPNFYGTIFDSSFSLGNTVDNFSIKDEKLNQVDKYSYNSSQGAAGDGKSKQKIENEWLDSMPTPGTINLIFTPKPTLEKVVLAVPKIDHKEPTKPRKIAQKEEEKVTRGSTAVEKIDVTSAKNTSGKMQQDSPIIFVLFFILLIISATSVYVIRKKKSQKITQENKQNYGEDFEIVD